MLPKNGNQKICHLNTYVSPPLLLKGGNQKICHQYLAMAHPLYFQNVTTRRFATSEASMDDPPYFRKVAIRWYSIRNNLWFIPSISKWWKWEDITSVITCEFSAGNLKGALINGLAPNLDGEGCRISTCYNDRRGQLSIVSSLHEQLDNKVDRNKRDVLCDVWLDPF